MRELKSLFLIFVFSLVYCLNLQAQDEGKNSFTVYTGFSPDSNTIFGIGRTKDAQFGYVGFQYAREFLSNDSLSLSYTAEVIPYARLEFPVRRFATLKKEKAASYGAAPIGLKIRFRIGNEKLAPFIGVSGGFLYFDKQIPDATGTKFNFTANLYFGTEIKTSKKGAIVIGYRYYHISNGGRGMLNPGFDNNVFFVGYKIQTK